MGADEDGGFEHGEMREMADAIQSAEQEGRLRAEHLLHLRCEVSADNVLQHFADFENDAYVRLVSLMDHAPGQRQFQTMDQYIFYYQKKRGLSDEVFARFIAKRQEESARNSTPHRNAIAKVCAERGITVASHDDATLSHVDEAIDNGVRLAEFPTSFDAARASHEHGMSVLMGAPNIVRGKSHSGNIAARDLAEMGVLDVLSSDYVPLSLLHAPFILADEVESISLPKAIAMVTSTPARTVSLDDRGRIATGLRADLVRVHRSHGVPVTRSVWRQGRRVA
jgi:alpha-D-ribose 1-methylphosphonate 5-triphosphate diphosphatase